MPPFLASYFAGMDMKRIYSIALTNFDIVWSFDPYRFQCLKIFGAAVNIYFSADWHVATKLQNRIVANADIVFCPSRALLSFIKTGTPAYFLSHAVSEYFFTDAVVTNVPGKNQVKVGYVGNLQSKFLHFSLLKNVIQENRTCDFLFVGDDSSGEIQSLMKFENVYFFGKISNEKVPSFLNACDILLLCYDTENYGVEASNSHKIMEYLASGRSVISTRVREYEDQPELILMPDANSGLPALLQKVALELSHFNSIVMQERRKHFARKHTYPSQLERVDNLINEFMLN